MSELKIGMIGLDTSHVVAFTRILNDSNNEHFLTGGNVVIAYPGGSSDMELSYNRIEGFTKELREKYKIEIVGSPEEVAEKSDAILLESVDGRVHLEQFRKIASFGKPTFIDKPFTTTTKDAKEIIRLAEEHGTPIMSSSSLRYSEGLMGALEDSEKGRCHRRRLLWAVRNRTEPRFILVWDSYCRNALLCIRSGMQKCNGNEKRGS